MSPAIGKGGGEGASNGGNVHHGAPMAFGMALWSTGAIMNTPADRETGVRFPQYPQQAVYA